MPSLRNLCNNKEDWILDKRQVAGLIIVLFCIMFPYIWQGQGVNLIVQDNLDSNIAWYTALKEQGKILAAPWDMVDGMVISTPRFSYPSGLNIELALFAIFSPFWAFIINKLLIILFAFFSMRYMLLTLGREKSDNQVFWWSLVWMSLAFYPHRGISIAALPMVFALIHQVRIGNWKWQYFFWITVYVFYSMFLLAVMHIWLVFGAWVIVWMIKDRKLHGRIWLLMVFWLLLYAIQDYHYMYYYFFQNDFVSHRSEMNYSQGQWNEINIWDLVKMGDHVGTLYPHFMVFVLLGVWAYIIKSEKKIPYIFTFSISFIFLVLLVWMISNVLGMDWISRQFPALKSINLIRFNHIFPFLIMGILGLALTKVKLQYVRVFSVLLITINILIYQYEWRYWWGNGTGLIEFKVPSFKEYYAEEQYEDIKDFLGDNWSTNLVGHINLPPAVSVYNGFQTVDGYLQNYDVRHKLKVGEVIKNEIEKDDFLFSHFFDWGNKCYLLNASYPDYYTAYKWQDLDPILELDFDFEKLRNDLGVKIVFSSIPIEIPKLLLLQKFEHEESAWDIYVYEVDI